MIVIAAALAACSVRPTSSQSDVVSRTFVYAHFAAPGERELKLVENIEVPEAARDQCGLIPPVSPATTRGGVLVPIIAGWIAGRFIKGAKNWVASQILEYSTQYVNEERYESFYESDRWAVDPSVPCLNEGDQLRSCFVAASISCTAKEIEGSKCVDGKAPDLILFGEYLRTDQALRMRPLGYYMSRVTTKRAGEEAPVSISAHVSMKSVWSEGAVGQSGVAFDQQLLQADVPVAACSTDPKKMEPVSVSTNPADWLQLPALPLPGRSAKDSPGIVATSVTIAETSPPPAVLEALESFLTFGESDLSATLTEALQGLID